MGAIFHVCPNSTITKSFIYRITLYCGIFSLIYKDNPPISVKTTQESTV
ncbi:hypothetical protein RINTHM_11520 [Richelia intracellularis HM01]|nr:hypothetical protein RINTHM_11520 [Richelia intracellularis HM01]